MFVHHIHLDQFLSNAFILYISVINSVTSTSVMASLVCKETVNKPLKDGCSAGLNHFLCVIFPFQTEVRTPVSILVRLWAADMMR